MFAVVPGLESLWLVVGVGKDLLAYGGDNDSGGVGVASRFTAK